MPSKNISISVKTLSHDCQQVPLSTVVDNPPKGNLFLIDLISDTLNQYLIFQLAIIWSFWMPLDAY